MNALDTKRLRDLWRLRGQVLAIAVVLAAAAAIFVLSAGTHASLTLTRDVYYARNGFADVFAELTRAPADNTERAAAIPGVAKVEGGIRQLATLDMPGRHEPMRAIVNSVPEYRPRQINRVTLLQGRMPSPDAAGEIVADEAFAEANTLRPGDTIDAVIYGKRQTLRIVGIGLAPDHIFSIAPGELVPDNRRFGVLWMGERALAAATDRVDAINTLVVLLERDAGLGEVIRQLDALTRVIPPVFLVVATFIVLVVLGRLIRTERAQIGLMKAFGYSNAAIGWHYGKFALVIAILASVLGCAAGVWMGRAMTGLLFATLQFHDSSRFMIQTFFVRAQAQELTVTFTQPRNEQALHELEQLPGVIRVEPVRAVPVRLSFAKRCERAVIESVSVASQLSARIDRNGAKLAVPPQGLMLSRQLADQLGVKSGAAITVQLLDGERTSTAHRVASVVDEVIGARAYAAEDTLLARRVLALDLVRVPVGALFRGPEGKWQVFVIDAGRARLRTVTIGQINEDWGEVRGGLDEGHRVVLNPANTRREGQRVCPR